MRRVVFDESGSPEEVLRLEDVPDPGPPGPGLVTLRLQARPIHPANFLKLERHVKGATETFSGEAVGLIEAVGPGVSTTDSPVGLRVVVFYATGSWSDRITVPADEVYAVPESGRFPDSLAAQALINPLTARMLLAGLEAVRPADGKPAVVVQTAAASSVGRLILQLVDAARAPFRFVHLVRSRSSAQVLTSELGGDAVVIATEDEDWESRARQAANGRPISAVLDPVGGAVSLRLGALLGERGLYIPYGAMNGGPFMADPLLLAVHEIEVRGLSIVRWMRTRARAERSRAVAATLDAVMQGSFRLPVVAEYDLAEAGRAMRHARVASAQGKVILTSYPPESKAP